MKKHNSMELNENKYISGTWRCKGFLPLLFSLPILELKAYGAP
jgi:hypothetical protein